MIINIRNDSSIPFSFCCCFVCSFLWLFKTGFLRVALGVLELALATIFFWVRKTWVSWKVCLTHPQLRKRMSHLCVCTDIDRFFWVLLLRLNKIRGTIVETQKGLKCFFHAFAFYCSGGNVSEIECEFLVFTPRRDWGRQVPFSSRAK